MIYQKMSTEPNQTDTIFSSYSCLEKFRAKPAWFAKPGRFLTSDKTLSYGVYCKDVDT